MKKLSILLAIGAIFVPALVFSGFPVTPPIPHLINYQGMLTDNEGDPMEDGEYDITFKIYNDPASVDPSDSLWAETHADIQVTNGLFNVTLGSVNPINLNFYEAAEYWLDITVEGEHMTERMRFLSVAFAYRAQKADTATYAIGVPQANLDSLYVNVFGSDSISYFGGSFAFRVKSYNEDGIYVYAPEDGQGDGIRIDSAGDNGIEIYKVKNNGIYLDRIHDDGIEMTDVDHYGLWMDDVGWDGIHIGNTGWAGISINDNSYNAIHIDKAGDNGVYIKNAGDNGVHIDTAGMIGVYMDDIDSSGVHIKNAGGWGVHIERTGKNGIRIDTTQYTRASGFHGIWIRFAGGEGVYIESTFVGSGFNVGGAANYGITARGDNGNKLVSSDADHYGLYVHSQGNATNGKGLYVYGDISCTGVLHENAKTTGGFTTPKGFVRTYGIQSQKNEFMISGTGRLANGVAHITFDNGFSEGVSSDAPLKVIVTPTSECNGVFVASKSSTGFTVKELLGGTGNAEFDWIAIGQMREQVVEEMYAPPELEEELIYEEGKVSRVN